MTVIRFVKRCDAEEILKIYAPYITDNAVSFECSVPALEDFAGRIAAISAEYPYLVCLRGDAVAGYAYAHRQMEREAYQWNAELSIYIAPGHKRRGIGQTLYSALIDILRLQNVRTVYGGVTVPNPASERLHESMGFAKLGTYHKTGFKCGSWHDVAWFEKQIGEYSAAPKPFIPIYEADQEAVGAVLARYSV